jgi:plastocyanin
MYAYAVPGMRRLIAIFAAAWIATACGDSATGPTQDATITITAAGLSPREVQLKAWNQVTFVNNDTQPHNIVSDPVNEHTQCPAINNVGFLPPGATRQTLTMIGGVCGFHDHLNLTNDALRGTIRVE